MSEILTDGAIKLVPGMDLSYLTELALRYKYNWFNEYGIKVFSQNIKYFWKGYAGDVLGGLLFLQHIHPGRWFFDAYKDDEKLKALDNRGNFSYKSGRLVVDWFFERKISDGLFTAHDQRNRGATMVCKKLGFREIKIVNGFVVMQIGGTHGH